MAERPVQLHSLAADEAEAARSWYLARNPLASAEFLKELDAAMEHLASAPERWPKVHGRYRRYLLHKFPFSIVYLVRSAYIEVIAVAHHRRRPGYWRNR